MLVFNQSEEIVMQNEIGQNCLNANISNFFHIKSCNSVITYIILIDDYL